MTFGSTFGRTFSPTFQPKSQAAAVASSWWLAGGISAANCIAAYQAKGAASYKASKVNLANPGTNDLTPISEDPKFDTSYGWYFTRAYSMHLLTGALNLTNPSVIIRYSDILANTHVDRGWVFGNYAFTRFAIRATLNNVRSYHYQTTSFGVAGNLTTGVVALTKDAAYIDGAKDTDIGKAFTDYNRSWGIGGDGGSMNGAVCKIQAVAIYNNYTLSLAEVQALTTAMNAL